MGEATRHKGERNEVANGEQEIDVLGSALGGVYLAKEIFKSADEDGYGAGEEHLTHLNDKDNVKSKLQRRFEARKKWTTEKVGWFVTFLHLRRGVEVHDTNIKCWQSTKEFRESILESMETQKFELGILFLVLCDVVLVILEAVLDSLFHWDAHRRLRMEFNSVGEPSASRFLGGAVGGSCEIEKAFQVASTCRLISLAILFVFAAEMLVKFICAPIGFSRHFGHVLDGFVIIGSIILEFTLHHSTGGFLIFFRMWRFVRILHGVYEEVEYMHKALETGHHLEKALKSIDKLKGYLDHKDLRADYKAYKHQSRHGHGHQAKMDRLKIHNLSDDDLDLVAHTQSQGQIPHTHVENTRFKAAAHAATVIGPPKVGGCTKDVPVPLDVDPPSLPGNVVD